MAFAKRQMPLVVAAEAAGEIAAVGPGTAAFKPGDPVVMYGALTCGHCKACREGRDNLCENVAGIMGFHVDGFARDLVNMPARLVIPVPAGVAFRDAACAPIAFSTVQHMLFDNAKLEPGETVLVHAGGSGIGTVAIKMAKAIGCTVITTVGDDAKAEKARALGADHVINYRTDRFEGAVRKLTAKKGVDVVFEHVGADTFNGSLLVPQARRPAGDLRRDVGRLDDVQPDAAVPAAVPDHRLVRRIHAQHPREPRQDGRRHASGHRHRGADRKLRARPRAPGKPAGVRKNRGHALSSSSRPRERTLKQCGAQLWRLRAILMPLVGQVAVVLMRLLRRGDRKRTANFLAAFMRTVGPWLREHRVARANLTAAFPEKSPQEIEAILSGTWDNLGRVAAEFLHLDRITILDPREAAATPTSSTTDVAVERMRIVRRHPARG